MFLNPSSTSPNLLFLEEHLCPIRPLLSVSLGPSHLPMLIRTTTRRFHSYKVGWREDLRWWQVDSSYYTYVLLTWHCMFSSYHCGKRQPSDSPAVSPNRLCQIVFISRYLLRPHVYSWIWGKAEDFNISERCNWKEGHSLSLYAQHLLHKKRETLMGLLALHLSPPCRSLPEDF